MNPYPYSDYRRYLDDFISKSEGRGAKAALAEAAGCQRSFLSQVLGGQVNLTLEHAIGIAHFLRLNSQETEYLHCLVAFARSGTPELRKFYAEKMKALRWDASGASSRKSESGLTEYYSSWKFGAVHLATTIPGARSSAQIARRLTLELADTEAVLRKLKLWRLVEEKRAEWIATSKLLHLPEDHFLTATNHRNWRAKSMARYEDDSRRALVYSSIYSMSRADFESLRELTSKFLAASRTLVAGSAEEELVIFNLDCVPLG